MGARDGRCGIKTSARRHVPGEEHGLPRQSRALQRPRLPLLADFLEGFAQAQLRRVLGLRRLKLKKDLFPLPAASVV